jgi:hypothetical protein
MKYFFCLILFVSTAWAQFTPQQITVLQKYANQRLAIQADQDTVMVLQARLDSLNDWLRTYVRGITRGDSLGTTTNISWTPAQSSYVKKQAIRIDSIKNLIKSKSQRLVVQ